MVMIHLLLNFDAIAFQSDHSTSEINTWLNIFQGGASNNNIKMKFSNYQKREFLYLFAILDRKVNHNTDGAGTVPTSFRYSLIGRVRKNLQRFNKF